MLYQATSAAQTVLQPYPAQLSSYQLWKREQAREEIRRAATPWKRYYRHWLSLALAQKRRSTTPEEAHPNAAIQQLHHEA